MRVMILLSLFAVGCSRSSSSTAPKPSASASAVSTAPKPPASVAVVVGTTTAPAAPLLPLPPPPPGTDPERVKIAASICAAAYLGKAVGCRSHSPFVRPEQKPDGKILKHKGDPLGFCPIDAVFRGSFTRAGAKQAVVSFGQCKESDDTAWDASAAGSVVLVEEIDGRWQTIDDVHSVNTQACLQNRRADGRDVLLCRSGLTASPGAVMYVVLLDFARKLAGKVNAGSLVKLFSDETTCMATEQGLPFGLVALEVASTSLADLNKDGTPDLVVKIKRARIPPSPSLDASVRALCKKKGLGADLRTLLPTTNLTTLEFVSVGDRFVPSAATKTAIDAWTAEAPPGFGGLSEVGPPLFTE